MVEFAARIFSSWKFVVLHRFEGMYIENSLCRSYVFDTVCWG